LVVISTGGGFFIVFVSFSENRKPTPWGMGLCVAGASDEADLGRCERCKSNEGVVSVGFLYI
jgi:hypothetical protein